MSTISSTIDAKVLTNDAMTREGCMDGKQSPRPAATGADVDSSNSEDVAEREAHRQARGIAPIVDLIADPEQVRTNYRLIGVLGAAVIVVLIQSIFNLTLYLRRPDTIVVDRTAGGDRVVVMNNREYGLSDNVSFQADRLTDGDKKYVVSKFLELYYGNNPDYRDQQLNEAIGLMVASRGRELFNYLKSNRILEQQSAESWQAVWTPQQITVDSSDPFTVRVIGVQNLTRVINQRPVEEAHQLNLTVKVAKDELGREARNKRTGYQVTWFGWDELKDTPRTEASAAQANAKSTTTAARSGM